MAALSLVAGQVTLKSNITLTKVIEGVTTSAPSSLSVVRKLTGGTGLLQGNVAYLKAPLTLTADQLLTLNLSDDGAIKDRFGDVIAMTILKAIFIENVAAQASVLEVGGNAAEVPYLKDVSDIISLKQNAAFCMIDTSATGICAVATSDLFQLHNLDGANSLAVNIHIIGVDDS